MDREPDDERGERDGDHAAERRRQFLEERFPHGEPPSEAERAERPDESPPGGDEEPPGDDETDEDGRRRPPEEHNDDAT